MKHYIYKVIKPFYLIKNPLRISIAEPHKSNAFTRFTKLYHDYDPLSPITQVLLEKKLVRFKNKKEFKEPPKSIAEQIQRDRNKKFQETIKNFKARL